MGRSVLVIDTDPQANATLGLGVHPETIERNIYQYYMNWCNGTPDDTQLSEYIIKTVSGIDLVPSHLDLVGAEPFLYQHADRYHILDKGIQDLHEQYDNILIDTPPFLGQFLLNGMIAADRSILVFSPDTFALAGYDHLSLIIRDISEVLGVSVEIGMAILNRWNNNSEKQVSLRDKIYSLVGIKSRNETETKSEIKNLLEKRIQVEIPEVVVISEGKDISRAIQLGIPLITLSPEDPALPGFEHAARIIEQWR